jgi:mycofactocin system glycosyltransferase
VPFVPTAALVVRRAALEAIGGFDETLRFGEDVDFVWRLDQAGWTVRYDPAVTVAHPSRPTAAAWLRQRFDYGTSAAPLARRHGAAVAPLAVSPWSLVSWCLEGIGHPAAGATVAAITTAQLAPRLRGLQQPWTEAARLAGAGHLHAGTAVADAVRRAWWPIALGAGAVSRRARLGVAAAAIVPPLLEWRSRRPALDPIRWTALRLVDDVAYCAGVWAGCVRERSFEALKPDLTSWPGRRAAIESAADGAQRSPAGVE